MAARTARARLSTRWRVTRRRTGRRLRALRSMARRATRTIAKYALVSALSLAAGLAVVALYNEYGYHPVRNAATWASQPIRFAIAGSCASCHASEASAVATAAHAVTSCQACHGALAGHVADTTAAVQPAPECVVCHERVSGRPASFPQVTLALHFGSAACLLCHDPHTTAALAPPVIPHSLDRLPPCLVCHGPAGLRPVSDRHPKTLDGDCLSCHMRRGGSDE